MSSRQGYQRTETNEIVNAMRNPNNFESILVCTVVFIVVGLLMMVTGGVICLIYYTEITPPNFDSNYHRYVGSSMPRLVGECLEFFKIELRIMIVFALTIPGFHFQVRYWWHLEDYYQSAMSL